MIKILKSIWAPAIPLFLLISGFSAKSQDVDPYEILDSVKSKLDSVHEYSAHIEIEVDVDFIHMPKKNAQIYFKKPDKLKIKSKDFIMLPKRGLNNKLTDMLDEPFTAIYLGKEESKAGWNHIIRVVPTGRNPDIVLATLWINPKHFRIVKSESNTRKEGSFLVEFIYDSPSAILPAEMVFTFEIEKLSLPLKFIGKSGGMDIDRSKMDKVQEGKVYIRFSDYQINQNLSDDIFNDQEEDNADG